MMPRPNWNLIPRLAQPGRAHLRVMLLQAFVWCIISPHHMMAQSPVEPAVQEASSPVPPPPATITVPVTLDGLRVEAKGVSTTNEDDVKAIMEEQLALAGDAAMSEPLADDLAFFLRQRLLDLGYPEATVAWTLAGGTAVLDVVEGPRYTVGQISYPGNTSQTESDLTGYLLRPTHEKLGRTDPSPPLVESDIKKGAELVQRYYQAQGYLNAAVAEPTFTMRTETKMYDIVVRVTEGSRYNIGAITLTGTGPWEARRKEINVALEGLSGQPYSEVTLENTRKTIAGLYQQRGYFSASVTTTADPGLVRGGDVPVAYHIVTGNLYRVAGISVGPGFSRGAERLVRSSFKRAVNRTYSPSDLDIMHRQALSSDMFSRLDVTPKVLTDDTVTLELTGTEGPTRTMAAYVGYETFKGIIIGGELRKVNIFNSGNSAQVRAEYSSVGLNGGIKLFDPAIFNTPYNLNVELAADSQDIFDFQRRTVGGRATLARQWTRNFNTSAFAGYSLNESESGILTPEELGPDKYNLGLVGLTASIDFRDSPVLPTKGFVATASYSGTLGGDVSFTRADLSFALYRPLTKKLRVAALARTSAISPERTLDEVPIDLRLFNGGASSVRSFQERELGLKSDSGTPLGGTLSQTFSVELSYEVFTNFEVALFGDMGALTREKDDVFNRPEDVRYAIGLGLRYKLPVGPLRIDYGYNPDRQEGEDVGALHITFGYAFLRWAQHGEESTPRDRISQARAE